MKITELRVDVIGDGPEIDPDRGGVEPLACIRVRTDEGITGLSEVFRVPPGVVQATVGGPQTHFGRLLIGQEITHPERLWQRMWDALLHTNRRGWEVIILGALDVAIWDIYGRMLKRPVWELLGGVQRGPFQTPAGETTVVTPYCTLVSDVWGGEPMFAQQVSRAERLAAFGYRAFKVEPMMSAPRDVVELARRFRKALGSTPTLMVDVGYLFHDVPTAARVCRELEEFDIYFFETPFPVDSAVPYAELASRTSIPLAAGEHGVTRWEFLDMMDRGRVSVVQPYMTTCGGLTEAKRIVELARARGAIVCPGNWSTQILGAASVHLAAYSPITPFIEFAPAEVYDSPLRRELQQVGFPVRDGVISLPSTPGIGYDLPDDLVRLFRMT
ncbi:mandelate racemase/muconate lactonizing enzyme family protein [Fimbriiglobus ruber]|uniref:Mandelate racemase/muconate lactonizing enzyme family protein n=1 Tax=Fimbriiglobus ruber TaxID=1908690 RepID=A0A225D952_9BACT|nr:mandelate racemase/muconate lactonizing enzyme family protein [Fimbriiglobus ruber]OWK37503.1 mandelate racemase/muconate lactonizing enzyme family protein [Fimbriiglobus ruber]